MKKIIVYFFLIAILATITVYTVSFIKVSLMNKMQSPKSLVLIKE